MEKTLDTNDPKRVNGKDPLRQVTGTPQELFTRFSREANGFPRDAAIGAAANILLNALRQECVTRDKAEAAFNELFGRLKQTLVDHYDSASGRRRSVFPFNQSLVQQEVIKFKQRW